MNDQFSCGVATTAAAALSFMRVIIITDVCRRKKEGSNSNALTALRGEKRPYPTHLNHYWREKVDTGLEVRGNLICIACRVFGGF